MPFFSVHGWWGKDKFFLVDYPLLISAFDWFMDGWFVLAPSYERVPLRLIAQTLKTLVFPWNIIRAFLWLITSLKDQLCIFFLAKISTLNGKPSMFLYKTIPGIFLSFPSEILSFSFLYRKFKIALSLTTMYTSIDCNLLCSNNVFNIHGLRNYPYRLSGLLGQLQYLYAAISCWLFYFHSMPFCASFWWIFLHHFVLLIADKNMVFNVVF